MGDAYNAAIVFTITRDDGTALLPAGNEYGRHAAGPGLAARTSTSWAAATASSWFVDEDPADNTIQTDPDHQRRRAHQRLHRHGRV